MTYKVRNPLIDWEELTEVYNWRFGSDFTNAYDLLSTLSKQMRLSKLASRLGVSIRTLYYTLDTLGIPRSHRPGGPNNCGPTPVNVFRKKLFLLYPADIMAGMTAQEIALDMGFPTYLVYKLLSETGREYRRKRR